MSFIQWIPVLLLALLGGFFLVWALDEFFRDKDDHD